MKLTLDSLSNSEWRLYKVIASLNGTMEEKTQQLTDNGVFESYKEIHKQYFDLYNTVQDDNIKLEVLKRLIFLRWYSLVEPSCFTGIQNLYTTTVFTSYSILNDFIKYNKLDEELTWMLSFYSLPYWDWIILSYSENKLSCLTNFVKCVDVSNDYVPEKQLPIGSMDNRGQMGIYFKSRGVEKQKTN